MRGRLITLEGIEGAGKTTCIPVLRDALQTRGKTVLCTREPGGTPLAEAIRAVLIATYDEPVSADCELLLLYAARIQHLTQVIYPALSAGQWVICDRFVDATFAYQGAGRGVSFERIMKLNQWTMGYFVADYTVIFDVPVAVGLQRARKSRTPDRFEQQDQAFFERIRLYYQQLVVKHPTRYYCVDATRPLSDVHQQLNDLIDKIIGKETKNPTQAIQEIGDQHGD